MWCLFGNTPARFSLSEFENITALNCAPFVEDEDVTEIKVRKGLWKTLKVQRKSPCKRELKGALEDVYSWSTEDKIRFTYLSTLATVIIGEDDKKDSYTLDGFVQTLQVWAYNVVPRLGAKIGRPSNIDGPPILKFKGLKGTNNIDINLVSVADTDNIRNVFINHVTPTVSDDKVVDKKIDALLQAICKEGGLGLVTRVEHGTKTSKWKRTLEKKLEEKLKKKTKKRFNVSSIVFSTIISSLFQASLWSNNRSGEQACTAYVMFKGFLFSRNCSFTHCIVFIREWTIVLRLERSREWSFVKGVCFDQSCSPVSVLYSGDRGQVL
ncbi:hypothetical protein F2Q69_00058446 [Brassica cretica]|uniref:DUF1985 domain-containing protein n=1 Tax=Brassica cretica TaxID=69181 RepID=A0A8S9RP75_BRACR|nr:hypothetical protein F2Q69_00058446 [Brassica cretica]